jgi:hypothetical protein
VTATQVVQLGDQSRQRAVDIARLLRPGQLPAAAADQLTRALGQAVARCWSDLSQDAQHDLFEAAVAAEGEIIRLELAIFLHGKHARTIDALHAGAMPEPDSLGG